MDEVRSHPAYGDVAQRTRRAVLEEIVLRGPVSRSTIVSRTGLAMATVSRIASALLASGLVRESPPDQTGAGPGRPQKYLDLAGGGGKVLGIGIGRTVQTVIVADLKMNGIGGAELRLDALDDPDLVIERIAAESRRQIDANVPDRRRLLGGYLTLPGAVDPASGVVRRSRHLGWGEVALGERLAGLLGMPMKVEDLVVSLALAETRFGAARGKENVLVLLAALGVAAGLIVNGRPVVGHNFEAGALGLMPVTEDDGRATTLDRIAGGFGILRRLGGGDPADMPLNAQAEALLAAIERDREGDSSVAEAMTETGRALGRIAAHCALLVAPQTVVISGPLARAPRYVSAVGETILEQLNGDAIEIVASDITGRLGGMTATCGMAVCEYLLERPLDLAGLSASS